MQQAITKGENYKVVRDDNGSTVTSFDLSAQFLLVRELHEIREIFMEERSKMSTKIKLRMRSALFHKAWKMPHRPTEHDHQPSPYHSKNT